MKKLLIAAAVVAMPLGTVAVAAASNAGAAVPVIQADGSIHCSTIGGAVSFLPAELTTGNANTETTTIKATLKGCTTSGNTNLASGSVVTGVASGKIVTTSTDNSANSCGGLTAGKPQTLTVKWTSKVNLVVVQTLKTSVISFNGYDPIFNSVGDAGFDLAGDTGGTASETATSSFQGGDAGTSSDSNVYGKYTVAKIQGLCNTTGLAKLPLGAVGTATDPSGSTAG
jgi:hypothetical protein